MQNPYAPAYGAQPMQGGLYSAQPRAAGQPYVRGPNSRAAAAAAGQPAQCGIQGWQYLATPQKMGFVPAPPNHMSHALQSGQLQMVKAQGDSCGNKSIKFTVANTTGAAVAATIAMGSTFLNLAAMAQNLICMGDTELELAPGETREVVLDGYCGNSNFDCPNENAQEGLHLLDIVAPREHCTSQNAVWGWSDQFAPPDPEDMADDFTSAKDVAGEKFPDEDFSGYEGPPADRFEKLAAELDEEEAMEMPEATEVAAPPPSAIGIFATTMDDDDGDDSD